MKKILCFLAGALVLAGCAKENAYDDSAILEKIASLEQRVTTLESSIRGIQSAVDGMKYVSKFQTRTDESGKITAITVTYSTGETVVLEVADIIDPSYAPVLSIMTNGAGQLCWAINGKILTSGGQDVLVYQTPVFTKTEDGHLHVEVDGADIDLGDITGEKGEQGEKGDKGDPGKDGEIPVVQDGIIKAIDVTETAVIITYGDDSETVSIPLVSSFALKIEKTEYCITSTDPIEIPYTLVNATENTVVDVYHGSEISCVVKSDKIIITPKSADIECMVLVYADTKTGLTSIVKLVLEKEICKVVESADGYIVDFEDGTIDIDVVSNVDFEVKPQVEWLHYVSTKATTYTVTITADNNTATEPRAGIVNIVRAGTDDILQSIEIAQKPYDPVINLSKKETANCYLVSAAGKYKFAAVKGNTATSVGTVASAEVLWETYNNGDEVVANSVVAKASYADGYVIFETPESLKAGNAVIAAKDAEGVILWSWHIWIPATPVTENTYSIWNTNMMDRNLGALVATEASESAVAAVESYGLMYQWGRKDPFVGPKAAGTDENATVAGVEMSCAEKTGTNSSGDVAQISVEYSIANPTVIGYAAGDDWATSYDNTRWLDNEKSIYDPCPAGYKVPARDQEQAMFKTAPTDVPGWAVNTDYAWFTMGNPSTVFPICGYRDDYGPKTPYKVGKRVCILTTHISDDKSVYCFDIRSDGGTYKLSQCKKARAGYVRCVAVAAE